MRIFSFGGGVQSHAALILHKRGVIQPYDAFLFCNVGEDSENPETLCYIENVTRPYCEANGITFEELRRTRRVKIQSKTETSKAVYEIQPAPTIWEVLMSQTSSIPIPVYLQGGGPARRNCTTDWKTDVVAQYSKKRGATSENPVTVGLGISTDEYQRMKDSKYTWERYEYPLIDLRMSREACFRLIFAEGLPEPPKSSCFFCPFASLERWQMMEATRPDLFKKAVELERRINEKRAAANKDQVYLTRLMRPLDVAFNGAIALPMDESFCESGYCMV